MKFNHNLSRATNAACVIAQQKAEFLFKDYEPFDSYEEAKLESFEATVNGHCFAFTPAYHEWIGGVLYGEGPTATLLPAILDGGQ